VDNAKVVEIDLTNADDEDDHMDEDDGTTYANLTSSSSSAALVRILCTTSVSPPKWVSEAQRPDLISDTFSYHDDQQQLSISGHIRGKVPWDVNALVHIPNLGTFACFGVKKIAAPFVHGAVEEI
jgi:hypothetical protein